jgi:ketosteroid isomerase-like protein
MMTNDDDETQIRMLVQRWTNAIRTKDADGVLAPCAPDLVKFDLAPPLATAGPQALDRADLESWFSTWRGPIGFDLRDLSITVGDDLALCHGFVRISGTKTDGEWNDVWARQTLCLRRTGGAWRIVHEHTSVPFYMDGSARAAIDLQP